MHNLSTSTDSNLVTATQISRTIPSIPKSIEWRSNDQGNLVLKGCLYLHTQYILRLELFAGPTLSNRTVIFLALLNRLHCVYEWKPHKLCILYHKNWCTVRSALFQCPHNRYGHNYCRPASIHEKHWRCPQLRIMGSLHWTTSRLLPWLLHSKTIQAYPEAILIGSGLPIAIRGPFPADQYHTLNEVILSSKQILKIYE